jgi:uncharacterized protein (TIGR02246 family)
MLGRTFSLEPSMEKHPMRVRTLLLLTAVPFFGTACSKADDAAVTSDSAAGVAATAATDAGAVRQGIDAANAKFVDAVKRGDTTMAIADNYADDAIVMNPGTESWRGREAIRKGFSGMATAMTVKDFNLKTDDVALGGDLAVETGSYEMTVQPKGGKEMKDKGKYVVVWKRQADGSWKIVRDVFNSDVPPAKM